MEEIKGILCQCTEKNSIVEKMLLRTGENLIDLIDEQIELIRYNCSIEPLQSSDDLVEAIQVYCADRFEKTYIESICSSLKYRVVNTANHMGGIFSPQSFQGDMLFCELLERMSGTAINAPLLASTTVPLTNSANLRYIVLFNEDVHPYKILLFSKKDKMNISDKVEALTFERIKDVVAQFERDYASKSNFDDSENIKRFIFDLFSDASICENMTYAEQVPLIEKKISAILFDNKPGFAYLDSEKIITHLIKKDLLKTDSMIYRLLNESEMLRSINCPFDNKTGSLSGYMFKAVDQKNRIVPLKLGEDRVLRGKLLNGTAVEYDASAENLIQLIDNGVIYPAIASSLISLMFERGYTWLGGIFQAEYLPMLQKMISKAFLDSGYADISEYVMKWKCNGYISGPVFLLAPNGKNMLNNAGPYECIKADLNWDAVVSAMRNTSISGAHYMGLFEFYNDLTTSDEKCEDWYKIISEFCGENFKNNKLNGDLNVY